MRSAYVLSLFKVIKGYSLDCPKISYLSAWRSLNLFASFKFRADITNAKRTVDELGKWKTFPPNPINKPSRSTVRSVLCWILFIPFDNGKFRGKKPVPPTWIILITAFGVDRSHGKARNDGRRVMKNRWTKASCPLLASDKLIAGLSQARKPLSCFFLLLFHFLFFSRIAIPSPPSRSENRGREPLRSRWKSDRDRVARATV